MDLFFCFSLDMHRSQINPANKDVECLLLVKIKEKKKKNIARGETRDLDDIKTPVRRTTLLRNCDRNIAVSRKVSTRVGCFVDENNSRLHRSSAPDRLLIGGPGTKNESAIGPSGYNIVYAAHFWPTH